MAYLSWISGSVSSSPCRASTGWGSLHSSSGSDSILQYHVIYRYDKMVKGTLGTIKAEYHDPEGFVPQEIIHGLESLTWGSYYYIGDLLEGRPSHSHDCWGDQRLESNDNKKPSDQSHAGHSEEGDDDDELMMHNMMIILIITFELDGRCLPSLQQVVKTISSKYIQMSAPIL